MTEASYASANEIFMHLTVHQVHDLNKDYEKQAEQAKTDLHNLVGAKYRDLIKIAEDIDGMYHITKDIDSRVSDLSYRNSKFVSFSNANSYSKLDSSIRQKKALAARSSSKSTILNYLINKRLLAFDQALISGKSVLPYLLYFSKLYYTIEYVFLDVLSEMTYINEKYSALKQKFMAFLEAHLASYSPSNEDYVTTQFKVPSADVLLHSDHAPVLESHEFDLLDDLDEPWVFGEEDAELNLDIEIPQYLKNCPVIVVFLLSYVIMNHTNPELNTLVKILDNFIDLRINHLQGLLKEVSSAPKNFQSVKFFKILKFADNTCEYVNEYFGSGRFSNNDFTKQFKQATSTWKAVSVLGFHDWLDVEDVKFNQDIYLITIPHSSVVAMNESITRFSRCIFDFVNDLIAKLASIKQEPLYKLSNQLVIFHNLVVNLARIEISNISSGKESKLIKMVSDDDMVTGTLKKMIDFAFETLSSHYSRLDVLHNTISQALQNRLASKNSLKLFSSDLVELIDSDLNDYVATIKDASLSSSLTTSDYSENDIIRRELDKWFDVTTELDSILNTKSKNNSGLTQITSFMEKKWEELEGESIQWGTFSSSTLMSDFEVLRQQLRSEFWDKSLKFFDAVSKCVDGETGLSNLYYLLNVLIVFKTRIDSYGENENLAHITESYLKTVRSIYKEIFSQVSQLHLSEKTYGECIEHAISQETSITSRPSLRLSAYLSQFSSRLLAPEHGYSDEYMQSRLFSDPSVQDVFREVKNEFIEQTFVAKALESDCSSKAIAANVVYMLRFTGELIGKYSEKFTIDEDDLNVIVKGVHEYYTSQKGLYHPLLT